MTFYQVNDDFVLMRKVIVAILTKRQNKVAKIMCTILHTVTCTIKVEGLKRVDCLNSRWAINRLLMELYDTIYRSSSSIEPCLVFSSPDDIIVVAIR